MKDRTTMKIKKGIGARALSVVLTLCLVLGLVTTGIVIHPEKTAKAATDGLHIIYNNEELSTTEPYELKEKTMQLGFKSDSGNKYEESDKYNVSWTLEEHKGFINVNKGSSQTIAIVTALKPGTETLTLSVSEKTSSGDVSVGSTTIQIRVVFAIDTSNDSNFSYVYSSDQDRSLVMYTNSASKQLKLNFGDAKDATWTTGDDEVATVNSTGSVTAVGAGYTMIQADYTPSGSPEDTVTAFIGVYVLPMISKTNGTGYEAKPNLVVDDGASIFTDTDFHNQVNVIRSKIYWSIKIEGTGGTLVEIANSAGLESDMISLLPKGSMTNEMEVSGIARTYYVYFYAYNPNHASDITTANYGNGVTASMATLTIKSAIKDKSIVLGIGDSLNLAKSYNMDEDDFINTFNVPAVTTDSGSTAEPTYVTLDSTRVRVTGVNEAIVKVKMEIKSGKKDYVKKLLGLGQDDPVPSSFTTTLSIVDGITLGDESVILTLKQTYQLKANLHGTYSGSVMWNSSDPTSVSVSDTGLITGLKVTTTDVTITASVTIAGGITRTATCRVKVQNAMTKFTLNPDGDEFMNVGDVLTLEAVIKETVSVAPLRWISSKESVFTVRSSDDNKTAIVNALAGGTGTLIVENTVTGDRVSVDITVRIPITDLKFNAESFSFPFYQNGHNMSDELTMEPKDATSTKMIWTIDNTSVATIDSSGYLKFVAPGTVSITVRPDHNPKNKYANTIVKITGGPDNITFEGKDIKDDHMDLEVSETKTVSVKFEPETAQSDLVWSCDTKDIVLVAYDDKKRELSVIGRKVGKVTVMCRTEDNARYTFTVTVTQASTGLQFTGDSVTLYKGDPTKGQVQLKELLKMIPETSTDKVTYTSRDDKIASVDKDSGLVTAVAAGKTYVMATTGSGRTNSIDIIVIDRVTEIKSDFKTATVYIGETLTITPTVLPETASEKNIKWTWEPYDTGGSASVSLVEKVGSVDVTGESEGMVILTGVSVDNESAKVSYLLNVKYKNPQYNTKVTLSPSTKYINVGKKFRVGRKVTGAYKGNKTLKWKSSKPKVASVDSNGNVKAKKVGKATITATCQDGSKAKGKMKVVVRQLVTKIRMNRTSASIMIGKSVQLSVIITPANATVKGVTWKSSDTAIATVDGGKVIGMSAGTVKITATSKDAGKKKCYCWVTVTEPMPVTNFTVTNESIVVAKGKSVQAGITPNPVNTTDSISYWSDNPSVASVNSHGKISTHKVGQATIYAKSQNGVEAHVDVTVVDLNRKAVTLRQYDTEQLSVVMISSGVTWYSADPNIASVDENGLVTAKMPGTTIIYANVEGVKLGCRVTVTRIQ